MNLTLTINPTVFHQACAVAETMNKNLDQLIGEYLEYLISQNEIQRDLAELQQLTATGQGHSQGWRFTREELYERS